MNTTIQAIRRVSQEGASADDFDESAYAKVLSEGLAEAIGTRPTPAPTEQAPAKQVEASDVTSAQMSDWMVENTNELIKHLNSRRDDALRAIKERHQRLVDTANDQVKKLGEYIETHLAAVKTATESIASINDRVNTAAKLAEAEYAKTSADYTKMIQAQRDVLASITDQSTPAAKPFRDGVAGDY